MVRGPVHQEGAVPSPCRPALETWVARAQKVAPWADVGRPWPRTGEHHVAIFAVLGGAVPWPEAARCSRGLHGQRNSAEPHVVRRALEEDAVHKDSLDFPSHAATFGPKNATSRWAESSPSSWRLSEHRIGREEEHVLLGEAEKIAGIEGREREGVEADDPVRLPGEDGAEHPGFA